MLLGRHFCLTSFWLLVACGSGNDASKAQNPEPDAGAAGAPAADAGPDADDASPLPEYEGFGVSSPEAEGIDYDKLTALVSTGAAEHSSALIVVRDGHLVLEEYYGGNAQTALVAMSASKSVTSLGAGLALDQGKLTSLEQPVTELVPELESDPNKSAITVGHLLNHTSGLDSMRAGAGESIVAHAASSPMVFSPGASAQYNNNAVDLLAAVVGRAVGAPLDEYLDATLFAPLGAQGQYWMKDWQGVPRGAGEFFVRPIDAAKIGQMMLDLGKWKGEQIVSEAWVKASTSFDQPFEKKWGRLWWNNAEYTEYQITQDVLDHWTRVGISAAAIDQAKALLGKSFATQQDVLKALQSVWSLAELTALQTAFQKEPHLPLYHVTQTGPSRGFYAAGWLGQFIVVCTGSRIVGVRMRAPTPEDYEGGPQQNGFVEFPKQVCELAAN